MLTLEANKNSGDRNILFLNFSKLLIYFNLKFPRILEIKCLRLASLYIEHSNFLTYLLFCFGPMASFVGFHEIKFPSKMPRAQFSTDKMALLIFCRQINMTTDTVNILLLELIWISKFYCKFQGSNKNNSMRFDPLILFKTGIFDKSTTVRAPL